MSTRFQKLEWLRANPEVWRGVALSRAAGTERNIFEMMKAAGLFSRTTMWSDVNLAKLIAVVSKEEDKP